MLLRDDQNRSIWFVWLTWVVSFNQAHETGEGPRFDVRGFQNFEPGPSAFSLWPEQENGDISKFLLSQGGWQERRVPEARRLTEAMPGSEMKKSRVALR